MLMLISQPALCKQTQATCAFIRAGVELREQVAYLKGENESVGDKLEQEQSRATQV